VLNPNDRQDGIDTRPYESRQEALRGIEASEAQRVATVTRAYKRDARLIVSNLILSFFLAFSVYANIQQGKQGVREVPYVVLLDHLGNQQPLLRLDQLPVTPEQSQIVGVLMTWTELVRRISSDPQAFAKNWELADDYTSNTAMEQMKEFRKEQQQRQQQGTRVQISVPTVLPIGTSRSYIVEWEETAVDPNGRVMAHESGMWKATLTVADFQSKAATEERTLKRQRRNYRNIRGILIDDISWSGRPLLVVPAPAR
jgi:type IV secretory pathway TrbF-like protein